MGKRQNPVLRYTEALLSKPHLISAEAFNVISHYLEDRNLGALLKIDASDLAPDDEEDVSENLDAESGIGLISIKGSLTNEPVTTLCGAIGTSYESILADADYLLSNGAKTIILDIDSGGGEAFNCFASSEQFRKMCDDAGAYVYAYVGACACSAAYAWACVADEVIAHPDSTTGSIGVLIALINNSEQLKKAGIIRSFITAGDSKVPFADDGSFRPEFLEELQSRVDELYVNFVSHVSKYTGLSTKEIKDTEAKTYSATDALKLGLINEIMTEYEFTSYIVNKQEGASNA